MTPSETKVVRFDWAMKYFLRNKANFDLLEGFLSELLHTDIKIDQLLESESTPTHEKAKLTRVDLLADTDKGKVIIEVQVDREADYLSRILFGSAKAVTDYIHKGDPYHKIQKIYSVSILYFDLGQGSDYLYHGKTEFRGIHNHDLLGLNDKEKKVYQQPVQTPSDIFPEYYLIKVNQFRNSIKEKFDEWMYFFKNESIQSDFTAKGLQSAAQKLALVKMDDAQRSAYDRYMMDLSYENSMIESSYLDGMADGEARGEARGEAKLILSMHQNGCTRQQISQFTGLSLEKIQGLLDQEL